MCKNQDRGDLILHVNFMFCLLADLRFGLRPMHSMRESHIMVIRVITQHIKPLAISQITVGHCKAWPFESNSFQIQLGLLFLHTDGGLCNEIIGVCLRPKHDVFVCRILQEDGIIYVYMKRSRGMAFQRSLAPNKAKPKKCQCGG